MFVCVCQMCGKRCPLTHTKLSHTMHAHGTPHTYAPGWTHRGVYKVCTDRGVYKVCTDTLCMHSVVTRVCLVTYNAIRCVT